MGDRQTGMYILNDRSMEKPGTEYLTPTRFIDSDSPIVVEFAEKEAGTASNAVEQAVALYYAVRDQIFYNPYTTASDPELLTASYTIAQKVGFCIPKAITLAAAARALGIPSRLGFADVKNHLATKQLIALMRTDVFAYHGYTELFLEGQWVKATPTFNARLCQKFGVEPLPFDGRNNAIFQSYSTDGSQFMEYIRHRGTHSDLPFEDMMMTIREVYPHLWGENGFSLSLKGDFEKEAELENSALA